MAIENEIRDVAEQHRPDGGYGETAWNPKTKTVLWVPADWTEIEEEAAAHDAFLDIPGVEKVEGDAEQGVPKDKPWVRVANIFDPIQDSLDQRVFDGIHPKPAIAHFITEKFYSTMEDLLVDNAEQYFDLALTGSLTTYQYSDSSDCDISVFVHYDDLMDELGLGSEGEVRRELIHLVTTELDGTPLPGSQHPLQFFIIPPGNTIYNYFVPGMRSGYSFNTKGWIVPPEKKRVHDIASEMPDVYSRAAQMADKLKVLLDSHDIEAAKDMFAQIHKKRGDDEAAGLGDFSEGNIVYKYLLHEGLFDRLRNEAGVHIAKTASAPMYHVAPRNPRELILRDGLKTERGLYEGIGPEGVYLWPSTAEARRWIEEETMKNQMDGTTRFYDIYQVNTDDLNLQSDPTLKDAFYSPDSISPDKIQLLGDSRVASEREPIYYDFDRDKIIAKHDFEMARAGKIIGEYDGKDVFLHGTSSQWINPNYFKRLWVATWPTKPLDRIHMDGAAINTRPADAMTYTQKLPWLVKNAFKWYDNQTNYGGVPDEAYPWIYSPTLGLVMGEEGSTHPFIMDHEEPRLNQDDPAKLIYGRVWPEGSYMGKSSTEPAEPFGSIYSYSWNSPEQIAQAKQAVEGYFAKTADYDVPIENPVNYQFTPLVRNEIEGYATLPQARRNRYQNKAKSFNVRAQQRGNAGRVKGQHLYGLDQRYQGTCAYCNQPGADTYDHVIPLKNGGLNDVSNLLPVHDACNQGMNQWDTTLTPPPPPQFNMSPKWVGPDYQAEAHVANEFEPSGAVAYVAQVLGGNVSYGNAIDVGGNRLVLHIRDFSSRGAGIHLDSISAQQTNTGIGTQAIEALRHYADQTAQPLILHSVANSKFFSHFAWLKPNGNHNQLEYQPGRIASDPYRDGKEWKKWIKNTDIIVDFQVGDEDDDPVEGKVKEINHDSIKIEVTPGEFRTFDNDFLKQIKFKVRDDKKYLSYWKAATTFNYAVGDCPNGHCDYEFSPADHFDIDNARGWFTCPQCNKTYNVRTELGHKTSAS